MSTQTATSAEFRCYVADLAAYNAGRLLGEWIDLDGLSAEEMREAVAAVIARSPFPDAEEYAIHDWDGLPSTFGEWPDWDAVAQYVATMEELSEDEREAYALWCDNIGSDSVSAEEFREAYNGCYRSAEEFAERLADDIGAIDRNASWPLCHINWEAAWRDLRTGGDYTDIDGPSGVHIFRSC